MKKAKFIFMSNEDTIIDKDVSCKMENGYISFKLDEVDYRLDTKNFKFIRTNGNEEFILYGEKEIKAVARLIKENIAVGIKVLEFEKKFMDKKYMFKYNIESDENSIKTVILSLE